MPDNNVPQFKILTGGTVLPIEVEVDVLGVTVSLYTSGADVFTIELNNWNSSTQEYKWVDTDQFAPGVEVEIKVGFLDNERSLIRGEVTAVEPEYQNSKAPILKVHGYDRLHRFRRGRHTRSFVNVKDSDVASKLARELSLQTKVENSQVVHPYLFQNNQTNIDFLQERARLIRFEVDVANKTLFFRKAPSDRGKLLTLTFGDKLKNFFPRLTTLDQASEVVVRGWNPKDKTAIVGRGKKGDEQGTMGGKTTGPAVAERAFFKTEVLVSDRYIASQAEAEQIAKAQFNDLAIDFIAGEGTAIGTPDLIAGEVIELTRLGKRFNGLYYVTTATHVIKQQGYVTNFTVQRNAI